MKNFISLFMVFAMTTFFVHCQTGHVEDFDDGDLTGWGSGADYDLSNEGGELKIAASKTDIWNSFYYSFEAVDISENPYVSLKIKTDVDFNLNFSLWDIADNYDYPVNEGYQTIVHSDGYATYTFDFRDIVDVDLTQITLINFVFNPSGSYGCYANVYFDDIQIGDQALFMPAMSKIEDQYHGINASEVNVNMWGIMDRETGSEDISITATSSNTSLIPDPVVDYVSGNTTGTLTYTPVADQSGTAVITVVVSGNTPDDNVSTFNVLVEANFAPEIDQAESLNIQNDQEITIELSGLDDGDANANQSLSLQAESSNTAVLSDPVIEYSDGSFVADLILDPVDGQTGTVTVTVTVQDDGGTVAGGTDSKTMSFDVFVYNDVNYPPVMNEIGDISILEDSEQQTITLSGIDDGDEEADQNIVITAVSSNTELIADLVVNYTSGSTGSLSFTPVASQIGTDTITVTVSDEGGTAENNGDESTEYTFEVEVRENPVVGWEDDFEDGVLGSQWPAEWGGIGEDTHQCSEYDGAMEIEVDKTRTNNKWAGLWFQLPTEIDLSENPYISITMKTDDPPTEMLIFLWDAYNHYNTSQTVRHTVTGDYVEYYFDYSDPSYQLQGDGTVVDISRLKALLINFDPGGSDPLFEGSFFFEDFRIGEKAHREDVTYDVSFDDMPDFALAKDAGEQSLTIQNITDGGTDSNAVSLEASSDNTSLIPNPVIDAQSGSSATLRFTPVSGQTGTATISVTGSANGSNPLTKTFTVTVSEINSSLATEVNIDLNTTYQEIDGFGAFMGSGGSSLDTTIALAEDIGMSIARFGIIGGGFELVNDNSDPYITDLDAYNTDAISLSNMNRLAPFVDKFILSVWSPAGWMKLNKTEGGVSSYATDNRLDPIYYEEYAEEVLAWIKIVKRETGKDIYGVGLQNEPQFNEPYSSCQVYPDEFRDIIKVVGKRLEEEGLGDIKLYWAEALPAQGTIDEYIESVQNDPVAEQYADIVAIHNYDADGASVGGAGCETWGEIYSWAQEGNVPYKTWMTETSGHADDWDGAMTLAGNIFNALSCGNSSSWVWWSFAASEGSAEYGLVVSNRPSSRYYISKQYYKYIRPGAYRVEASSDAIPVMAFKNEEEKTVSVILFNNTDQVQTLQIKGESLPSNWEVYTTSESRNCQKQADVGPDGLIVLPPSSLTTLVGDNSNPSPTLDDVADIYVDENSGTSTVSLTGISDGEGFDQNLSFTTTSDNTDLIPDPIVVYNQGESTAQLQFSPENNLLGEATITIQLEDDGDPEGKIVKSFTIFVQGVNYAPEIDQLGDQSVLEDAELQVLGLTGITDGNPSETQGISVSAKSSYTNLIPDPVVDYTSGNATASLSFTPEPEANGTVTITVTVTDSGDPALSTEMEFDIEVVAVNDAPYIDDIQDPSSIDQGEGKQTIDLTGIHDGDGGIQTISIQAESNNLELIPEVSVDYSSGTTGSLSFTPAEGEIGTATVTVTVSDDGGTANDGVDTYSTSFDVNVVSTGILSYAADGLSVYPNPVQDVMYVQLEAGKFEQLEITDLSGRVLYIAEIPANSTAMELSVNHLPEGIYLLSGINSEGSQRIKIVIE